MAKYHVGKDGQARPCKAASPDSCPLAKADGSGVVKHFDDMADAQAYGERVVMGLANESPAQEVPVSGMRDDGHYVDDSGHVYPKMGQEWSDDDRAAYVAQAARDYVDVYGEGEVSDDMRSLADGDWDWDDIQRERQQPTGYGQAPLFEGEDIMLDHQWDALDSKYPVIDDSGDVWEADDDERPANDAEISEYVHSMNEGSLRADVSNSPTTEFMDDDPYVEDMSDAEKAAIRRDLEDADSIVSGAVRGEDFYEAMNYYSDAAEKLGYDDSTDSFPGPSTPFRDRLKDRWDMASKACALDCELTMSDLPDDPHFDGERNLEPGTFAIDDSPISLDLDDDDDDEYDDDGVLKGIRR